MCESECAHRNLVEGVRSGCEALVTEDSYSALFWCENTATTVVCVEDQQSAGCIWQHAPSLE